MPKIIIDSASTSLQEHFAVIYTKRKKRQRFPQGCITEVASEQLAIEQADPEANLYPGVVYGPSTSSEGIQIYYLVRWL